MSDEIWHVLIKTRNGNVSLLKNLTEDVARQAMQRLTPYWQRPGFKHPSGVFCRDIQDDDIELLEAFGPPGQALKVWPDAPSSHPSGRPDNERPPVVG